MAKGIKVFPKMGFYLYHPMVDRTELETGQTEKANHWKRKEKKVSTFFGIIFLGIKSIESELEVDYNHQIKFT